MKAERILGILNTEVDPCNNFYDFACGNWEKYMENEDSTSSTIKNMSVIIQAMLEGYHANENLTPEEQEYDVKNFEKLSYFFNSCMDTETINAKGIQPMLDLFTQLKIEENKSKYNNVDDLTDLLIKLDNLGLNFLFKTQSDKNLFNPKINSIYFRQPDLGLMNKSNYKNPYMVITYKNIMNAMFTKLFQDQDQNQDQKDINIEKMVESTFGFEEKLSEIVEDLADDPININQDVSSINSMEKAYPYINWKNYVNKRFEDLGVKVTFNENDENIMVVFDSPYYEKLSKVLKETDNETIALYAKWKLILTYFKYFGDDVYEIFDDYLTYSLGVSPKMIPRPLICTFFLKDNLSLSASKLFVERAFGGDSKKVAENMSKYIKESLTNNFSKLSWLDETTKQNAIKKASNVNYEIGYPDFIMDPKQLYQFYENLIINPFDLLSNAKSNQAYTIIKQFETIGKEVEPYFWGLSGNAPFEINAFFNFPSNKFYYLAGYIQEPKFSPYYPSYINYGSVGSTIGHELTHAFDEVGKEYDYEGKFNNWWTNSTEEEFNQLSKCFIDQYQQYYITDYNGEKQYLNGVKSLCENIADNGGVSRSYEAWKLSLEKDPEAKQNNKSLPGLSQQFTHDQLFFISFGQNWCSKEYTVISDEYHAPDKFRVLGSLVNNDYFAKTFNCPLNSPMNPEKKCKIW